MKIEDAIFYLKNTPVIASNADKETVQKAYDMAIEALERKKGKWILGEIETGACNVQYQLKICSECGWESSLVIPRNFCPNCGTDMRGE